MRVLALVRGDASITTSVSTANGFAGTFDAPAPLRLSGAAAVDSVPSAIWTLGNGPTVLTGGLRYLPVSSVWTLGGASAVVTAGAMQSTGLYYVDNKESGVNALRAMALHPVTHDLWVTLSGGTAAERTVVFRAGPGGAPPSTRISMAPAAASLQLLTAPSGSRLSATFEPFAVAFEAAVGATGVSALWVSDVGNVSSHNVVRFVPSSASCGSACDWTVAALPSFDRSRGVYSIASWTDPVTGAANLFAVTAAALWRWTGGVTSLVASARAGTRFRGVMIPPLAAASPIATASESLTPPSTPSRSFLASAPSTPLSTPTSTPSQTPTTSESPTTSPVSGAGVSCPLTAADRVLSLATTSGVVGPMPFGLGSVTPLFPIPYDLPCSLPHRVGYNASSILIDIGPTLSLGGVLSVSTCVSTNFDTVVAALYGCYAGASDAQAQCVAANDDAGIDSCVSGYGSALVVSPVTSRRVWIAVTSYGGGDPAQLGTLVPDADGSTRPATLRLDYRYVPPTPSRSSTASQTPTVSVSATVSGSATGTLSAGAAPSTTPTPSPAGSMGFSCGASGALSGVLLLSPTAAGTGGQVINAASLSAASGAPCVIGGAGQLDSATGRSYEVDIGAGALLGGLLTVDTCESAGTDSALDTLLAVGTGCPVSSSAFACAAVVDDSLRCGDGRQSRITLTATQQVYYAVVQGYGGALGPLRLNVSYVPPTPSTSATASTTASGTVTATHTATGSRTPSETPTRSESPTVTSTRLPSQSGTGSLTATRTTFASASPAGSQTPTGTGTATSSVSAAQTGSGTATATPTAAATVSGSGTRSSTASCTSSSTATGSATATQSRSESSRPTGASTVSGTATVMGTGSSTGTGTVTASVTGTATGSGTITPTVSRSGTATTSASAPATTSGTASGTSTGSPTGAATASLPLSFTQTGTTSGSSTVTATRSESGTATASATVTASVTSTSSGTLSATATGTGSETAAQSFSSTGTSAPTASPSGTSPTDTSSLSQSSTIFGTPTGTVSATASHIPVPSTPLATQTPSGSPSTSSSATASASSGSATPSSTGTGSTSPAGSVAPPTASASGAVTRTVSATAAATPSVTVTPLPTKSVTPSVSPSSSLQPVPLSPVVVWLLVELLVSDVPAAASAALSRLLLRGAACLFTTTAVSTVDVEIVFSSQFGQISPSYGSVDPSKLTAISGLDIACTRYTSPPAYVGRGAMEQHIAPSLADARALQAASARLLQTGGGLFVVFSVPWMIQTPAGASMAVTEAAAVSSMRAHLAPWESALDGLFSPVRDAAHELTGVPRSSVHITIGSVSVDSRSGSQQAQAAIASGAAATAAGASTGALAVVALLCGAAYVLVIRRRRQLSAKTVDVRVPQTAETDVSNRLQSTLLRISPGSGGATTPGSKSTPHDDVEGAGSARRLDTPLPPKPPARKRAAIAHGSDRDDCDEASASTLASTAALSPRVDEAELRDKEQRRAQIAASDVLPLGTGTNAVSRGGSDGFGLLHAVASSKSARGLLQVNDDGSFEFTHPRAALRAAMRYSATDRDKDDHAASKRGFSPFARHGVTRGELRTSFAPAPSSADPTL